MGKRKYESDVVVGEVYVDKQTGIKGTVVALCFYQFACERATLEVVIRDKIEEYTFDSPRLTHVLSGKTATTTQTGGDRNGVAQRTVGSR